MLLVRVKNCSAYLFHLPRCEHRSLAWTGVTSIKHLIQTTIEHPQIIYWFGYTGLDILVCTTRSCIAQGPWIASHPQEREVHVTPQLIKFDTAQTAKKLLLSFPFFIFSHAKELLASSINGDGVGLLDLPRPSGRGVMMSSGMRFQLKQGTVKEPTGPSGDLVGKQFKARNWELPWGNWDKRGQGAQIHWFAQFSWSY